MNKAKKILVLYEESGVFSNLYKKLGYEVIQVDLLYNQQDVRLLKFIPDEIHGILAFPPCTHFAGSGARWWEQKGDKALLEGLSCVDAVLRMVQIYKPKFWMIENPVGRLKNYIGKPQYYFNPYEFAGYLKNWEEEAYSKKTCLWGEFNKPIKKTKPNLHGSKFHTPTKHNFQDPEWKRIKSKTPLGFAKAFVEVNN